MLNTFLLRGIPRGRISGHKPEVFLLVEQTTQTQKHCDLNLPRLSYCVAKLITRFCLLQVGWLVCSIQFHMFGYVLMF